MNNSGQILENIVQGITEGILLLSKDFRILWANNAFLDQGGYKMTEILDNYCYKVIHRLEGPCQPPHHPCPCYDVKKTGKSLTVVHNHFDKKGNEFFVEVSAYPVTDEKGEIIQFVHLSKDITAHKQTEKALQRSERELAFRNQIANIFLTIADEEMYGEVLQVVLEAMESKYGVFGYVDEHGAVVCPSMTRDIWDKCQVPDKDIVFPREIWGGIWGRALIEKKTFYSNKGLRVPKGHISVHRAIATPIIYQAEVIGYFTVANKETDYDDKDQALLETIADRIAPILNARLQRDRQERQRRLAEEELRKAHGNLEQRVKERTAELVKANEQLRCEIEERKRAEGALRKSEEDLRFFSSQLLTVKEQERKRIVRELHDGIGQSLTTIKYGVENTLRQTGKSKATPGVESLEATISIIKEAMEEVRRIGMDLRPSTLDDLGILATISWLCREFQTIYSGISIEKQISIQEDEVPGHLKTVIYRVLQEALSNVAKHSKADLVSLYLRKTDGSIELEIKDNGLGFDLKDTLSMESSKRGFGLTSMSERTELSGGSFAIESVRGAGTSIRASWPSTGTNSI